MICCYYLCPLNRRGVGGGDIAFGADPDGIASCLHSITWTNEWILTNLHRHIIGRGDFGYLDLIFKVTLALWNFQILTKKGLSAPYLLNLVTESGQSSYIVTLAWFKDLIRFWWPWPNFYGHHTIKTVKMSLVCTLSPEPIGGFWPNLHRNTIGIWERNY